MQIGAKFNGSPSLQTSTKNQEIIPEKQFYYKFSFMNHQDCTVRINNSEPIFLRAGLGFSMNEVDAYINSFIVLESGIEFHWLGGSR